MEKFDYSRFTDESIGPNTWLGVRCGEVAVYAAMDAAPPVVLTPEEAEHLAKRLRTAAERARNLEARAVKNPLF